MTAGNLHVVVGGQYGSEAKGHVTGYLAAQEVEPTVIRVAGPNAGHTAYDAQQQKWSLRQIPVAAVTNPEAKCVIAAGSEIDPEVLHKEVHDLEGCGIKIGTRLFIDGEATVVNPEHREAEGNYGGHMTDRIGSTGKGVGAARADRIWRKAQRWVDAVGEGNWWSEPADTVALIESRLTAGHAAIIEGTQGYALGLHAGHYPYATSSDCRAIDFCAMAGVNPWSNCVRQTQVWVVLRTYPIRVAGNSGPLRRETDWDTLAMRSHGHIRTEYTTVTHMPRRVGLWDGQLARESILANGGPVVNVALMFFDYWFPEIAGAESFGDLTEQHMGYILDLEKDIGAPIRLIGTGPHSIIDLRLKDYQT